MKKSLSLIAFVAIIAIYGKSSLFYQFNSENCSNSISISLLPDDEDNDDNDDPTTVINHPKRNIS